MPRASNRAMEGNRTGLGQTITDRGPCAVVPNFVARLDLHTHTARFSDSALSVSVSVVDDALSSRDTTYTRTQIGFGRGVASPAASLFPD